MRRLLTLLCVVALASSAACSTVTITKKGSQKRAGDPTYEERKSFYLFGIVGGPHVVDTKAVCGTKTATQMQTVHTFGDRFLGIITIGIYWPRTARVWCE